jgi:two-component system cell cycle response regulator DivK
VKTVLIVEDIELNRDLLVQLLEGEYRLATAENGEAAIAQARAERPDLILMDLALPMLDGLEAVRAIRSEPANAGVRIIGVSSYAMPGDAERALEAGCDDYLTKPIDEQQLFEKLRLHLGNDG